MVFVRPDAGRPGGPHPLVMHVVGRGMGTAITGIKPGQNPSADGAEARTAVQRR